MIQQPAEGQTFFQIGYNAGFPDGLDSLNFIIDRYNDTRSYLDEEMKHVTYSDGMSMSFGSMIKGTGIFFGIGYTGAGKKIFAEGTDNSSKLIRRELKVKSRIFDIDLGFSIMNTDNLKILLGTSYSFGSFVVKGRVAEESAIRKEKWELYNDGNNLFFSLGMFLRIAMSAGLFIQPYFIFVPGDVFMNDVTEVNERINSNTYMNDPSPLRVKNNMFGVKIGLCLYNN